MKDFEILMDSIAICDRHVVRMNEAIEDTKQLFPITVKKLERLSKIDLAMLDVLTTKFAKLQGTIGQKIFPLMITFLSDADTVNKDFIDILNIMEKIGVLKSKEVWLSFRDIRNSITHDYPKPERTCQQLNLCASASLDLISYWQFLKKFIDDKVLVRYRAETS